MLEYNFTHALRATMKDSIWENLGRQSRPNWYLDPLVAHAKKRDHMRLLARWNSGFNPRRVLKTDLFEEAFGEDQLLFGLFPASIVYGVDLAFSTVRGAKAKAPDGAAGCSYHFSVADLRALPMQPRSIDMILSTSSLDHFDSAADFETALEQTLQALGSGGRLVLTLDNVWNPLYLPLKWISRRSWAPFPLGYTPSLSRLKKLLLHNGFEILGTDCLVHNPRMLSTLLFLALRSLLGKRGAPLIAGFLKVFSWLDHLPTRYLSACFVAVIAEKND